MQQLSCRSPCVAQTRSLHAQWVHDKISDEVIGFGTLGCHNCTKYGCVPPKALHTVGRSQYYIVRSDDLFETWSTPVEVTDQPGLRSLLLFSAGPARGVQTSSGRLVFTGYPQDGPGTTSIYSDDRESATNAYEDRRFAQPDPDVCPRADGHTWSAGGSVTTYGPSESAPVMLENNSIMLTMRTSRCCRLQARSDDNGESWVDARLTPTLHPGGLTAGITRMGKRLFVSNSWGSIRWCVQLLVAETPLADCTARLAAT